MNSNKLVYEEADHDDQEAGDHGLHLLGLPCNPEIFTSYLQNIFREPSLLYYSDMNY